MYTLLLMYAMCAHVSFFRLSDQNICLSKSFKSLRIWLLSLLSFIQMPKNRMDEFLLAALTMSLFLPILMIYCVLSRDVNGPELVWTNLSKLPSFEMIFLKNVINKVCFWVFFRMGYILALRDRISTEVKNA